MFLLFYIPVKVYDRRMFCWINVFQPKWLAQIDLLVIMIANGIGWIFLYPELGIDARF